MGLPDTAPLAGADAKLLRADEVLRELDAGIRAYLQSAPYRFECVVDVDAQELQVVVRVRESPPLRLGVLAGEFVHDVRSALDHVVWELAAASRGTGSDFNQFPICDHEKAFDSAIARRRLEGVRDEDRYRIWKLQPFNGERRHPAHWLAALRDLSNRDKHRLVLPTFAALSEDAAKAFELKPRAGVDRIYDIRVVAGRPFVDGAAIVSAKLDLSPDVDPLVDLEHVADLDVGFKVSRKLAITPLALRQMRGHAGRACAGFAASLDGASE